MRDGSDGACDLKLQLLATWNKNLHDFAACVSELNSMSNGDHHSPEELRKAASQAEEFRLATDNARLIYLLHREEHGC